MTRPTNFSHPSSTKAESDGRNGCAVAGESHRRGHSHRAQLEIAQQLTRAVLSLVKHRSLIRGQQALFTLFWLFDDFDGPFPTIAGRLLCDPEWYARIQSELRRRGIEFQYRARVVYLNSLPGIPLNLDQDERLLCLEPETERGAVSELVTDRQADRADDEHGDDAAVGGRVGLPQSDERQECSDNEAVNGVRDLDESGAAIEAVSHRADDSAAVGGGHGTSSGKGSPIDWRARYSVTGKGQRELARYKA